MIIKNASEIARLIQTVLQIINSKKIYWVNKNISPTLHTINFSHFSKRKKTIIQ